MKELKIFDRKDYDPALTRFIRNSVRAIIFKNCKIGLLYSEKYQFYSFPGGGIEENESHVEALYRELKEETGLTIKSDSIIEFGLIIEIRKDIKVEGIYEKRDYFYICDVEDTFSEIKLTKGEEEAGYKLEYVTYEEAINKNELDLYIKRIHTEAETYVMKLLKESRYEYNRKNTKNST